MRVAAHLSAIHDDSVLGGRLRDDSLSFIVF